MRDNKNKWLHVLILSVCIAICYIYRTSISTSIIEIAKELNIDARQQGYILSAFSFGYVAFMLIGGMLADKFGAKKVLIITMLLLSITTILFGTLNIWIMMLAFRFLIGALEAPAFPSSAKFVNKYFEVNERGRATSIFDTGSYVGAAICTPIIVYFIANYSWRWSQLFFGILGLIWVLVWARFSKHDTASKSNDTKQINKARDVVLQLLSNKKILGASLGAFCYNYSKSFFLTWMPTYLAKDLGFSILKIGFIAVIPSLGAIIGNLSSGIIADTLINKGFTLTKARKLPLCIGMILSCVIMFAPFIESEIAIICLLTFSFAMNISASPSIWAIPGDIAPSNSYVGTIGGIQNSFANLAGIIAPIITGFIVYSTGTFTYALIISGILCVVGASSYWFIVGEIEKIQIKQKVV